jgi:hypothetical protein
MPEEEARRQLREAVGGRRRPSMDSSRLRRSIKDLLYSALQRCTGRGRRQELRQIADGRIGAGMLILAGQVPRHGLVLHRLMQAILRDDLDRPTGTPHGGWSIAC